MKKIVAVFLAFMIAALFVACGDKDDNNTNPSMLLTDVPTLSSSPSQPNVGVSTAANLSAGSDSSPTMILTTQRGQVMPTVVTTDFVPDPAVAEQNSTNLDFNLTVPSTMTAPVVYTSNNPTQAPTTSKKVTTTEATTDEPTEEETEEPTEKPQPLPKAISEESVGILSNGHYEITFSPEGWGGGVKTKSSKISVFDSEDNPKIVTARVAGADDDGNFRIIIDTSDLEDGDYTFTLPEQFVESKDGLSYSSEYTASASILSDE